MERKIKTASIGREIRTGRIVKVSEGAMNKSILILGTSGSGKTWAAKQIERDLAKEGAAVVVINMNHTHDELEEKDVSRIMVKEEGFPWPLLDPEELHSEEEYDRIQQIIDVFDSVEKLGGRQRRLLKAAVRQAGVDSHGAPIDFSALGQAVEELGTADAKTEEACEMVLDKFAGIFRLRTRLASVPVPENGKISVVDLGGYDSRTQKLLAKFTLAALWKKVRCEKTKTDSSVYVVLDEFQTLPFQSGDVLEEILREGRKYGLNLILITQTLASFKPDCIPILQLAAVRLYFPLADKECRSIAKTLGKREAESLLRGLSQGEALATGEFDIEGTRIAYPLLVSFRDR